jgi:hypothetical protein
VSVGHEADVEEVGGHDVDQVADDERKGRGVRDEPPRHHEGQDGAGRQPQRPHLLEHDRGQDERGTVVREESRHQRTEEQAVDEQTPPAARGSPYHVQGGPLEEAHGVQDEGDQDHRDEGQGGVPHDLHDRPHVCPADHAEGDGQGPADGGRPPDAEPPGLPNHEHEHHDEQGYGQRVVSAAARFA